MFLIYLTVSYFREMGSLPYMDLLEDPNYRQRRQDWIILRRNLWWAGIKTSLDRICLYFLKWISSIFIGVLRCIFMESRKLRRYLQTLIPTILSLAINWAKPWNQGLQRVSCPFSAGFPRHSYLPCGFRHCQDTQLLQLPAVANRTSRAWIWHLHFWGSSSACKAQLHFLPSWFPHL